MAKFISGNQTVFFHDAGLQKCILDIASKNVWVIQGGNEQQHSGQVPGNQCAAIRGGGVELLWPSAANLALRLEHSESVTSNVEWHVICSQPIRSFTSPSQAWNETLPFFVSCSIAPSWGWSPFSLPVSRASFQVSGIHRPHSCVCWRHLDLTLPTMAFRFRAVPGSSDQLADTRAACVVRAMEVQN